MRSGRWVLVSAAAATAFVAAGCAASSGGGASSSPASSAGAGGSSAAGGSTSAPPSSAAGSSCSPSSLHTHTAGTFTVATDSPAYGPWFVDDKPSNGKGFESAVAFAVAKQLGYSTDHVKWVVAAFNSVIAPGPKNFDVDVNQVSITDARKKAVDFSSGYYDVNQSIVTLKSSKYAKATSIAGFKGAKLAAQKGTTSLDAINQVIKPGRTPAEYPTNDLAVEALKNGTVDGLVVDLPTGFYVTSAQVQDAKIVGQLPASGTPEQFGMVLEKGSSLTTCVSQAVDTLRANGTLAQLQQKWLADAAGAPVLK